MGVVGAILAALAPVFRELFGVLMERAAGPKVESVTDADPELETMDARTSAERNAELLAQLGG